MESNTELTYSRLRQGARSIGSHADRYAKGRGAMLLKAGRAGLFMLTGVWVILYNNSRIIDNVPDHIGYSWLSIPREIRIVEAAVVLLVFFILQPLLARSCFRDLNALLWMLMAIAVIGVLRMPTNPAGNFQGIYVYLAPFLIYAAAWKASSGLPLLKRFLTLFAAYLALSISIALLVQFPEAGRGDLVHGLFSDAHVLGSFLTIVSCVAFGRFLYAGGLGFFLLSASLFFASLYPLNEKAILFSIICYVVMLVKRFISHPRCRRAWITTTLVCVLTAGALNFYSEDDAEPLMRISLLSSRLLLELGPIQAWKLAWNAISDSPVDIAFGLGPGNFAGLAAQRAVQEQLGNWNSFGLSARDVLGQQENIETGAIDSITNTWSNLLAEFGLIGFGVFALALIRVSLPLYRWSPATPFDRFVRSTFLVMLALIIWQGSFTPYTNWADPVLVYPMAVLAAYCHRAMPAKSQAQWLRIPTNIRKSHYSMVTKYPL